MVDWMVIILTWLKIDECSPSAWFLALVAIGPRKKQIATRSQQQVETI